MKTLAIIAAALALGTGLRAALLWWQSSKVEIKPGIRLDNGTVDPTLQNSFQITEAVDAHDKAVKAMVEAAALNADAAIWTAASVVLGAISSVLGNLS